jgi:hypothetical protein
VNALSHFVGLRVSTDAKLPHSFDQRDQASPRIKSLQENQENLISFGLAIPELSDHHKIQNYLELDPSFRCYQPPLLWFGGIE